MSEAQSDGKRTCVFPDLELPPPGQSPLKGHESIIVLNMNRRDAHVTLTLYFTDRKPVELNTLLVEPERVRCFWLDDRGEMGFEIPLETQYAARVDFDLPVAVQYGRLDSRQPNLASYTTMGRCW